VVFCTFLQREEYCYQKLMPQYFPFVENSAKEEVGQHDEQQIPQPNNEEVNELVVSTQSSEETDKPMVSSQTSEATNEQPNSSSLTNEGNAEEKIQHQSIVEEEQNIPQTSEEIE
jgi:hypothetical protein